MRVRCTLAVQEHELRATTLHCKVKRRLSSHFTVPFSQPWTLQGTLHLISSHTLATLDTQQTFTQRSFYTQKPEAFAHRSFYTEKLFAQKPAAFAHSKLLHTEARSFCTQKLLHTPDFYTEKLLHREASTQKLLHTEAFTHRSF